MGDRYAVIKNKTKNHTHFEQSDGEISPLLKNLSASLH